MVEDRVLRFRISQWDQLDQIKSNNSHKLHIVTSKFIQDKRLSGTRILLHHEDFGVLFACVVANGDNSIEGTIIDEIQDGLVHEFSPQQIVDELGKYGFIIEYKPTQPLPTHLLIWLNEIHNTLRYDKIRILYVHWFEHGIKRIKWYVVAFNIKDNPDWINNAYSPHEREFKRAIDNGTAVNLSVIGRTQRFNWSWLIGYVMDIQSILEDHS